MNEETYYRYYQEELEHFKKTKVPRCVHCKKNWINAKDSNTKKISKYLWKPDCYCVSRNIRLSIGGKNGKSTISRSTKNS